jgi:hypothetical protein
MTKDIIDKNDSVAQDAALLETMVDAASTMELHRSHLMRLQVQELLEECQLDMKSRKWASDAEEYIQLLAKYISQVNHQTIFEGEQNFDSTGISLRDRADRVVHIEPLFNRKTPLLHMEPLGCTKSQFGWTKKSGNAQQLPTFSLMVQLPTDLFLPKDYLHYRYFDVSCSTSERRLPLTAHIIFNCPFLCELTEAKLYYEQGGTVSFETV